MKDVVGSFFFDVFFFGEGLELSVGRDRLRPLAQVVLGPGQEEVGTGQVGGIGEALNVGSGQFRSFLKSFVVVRLDDFFGGVASLLGMKGKSGEKEKKGDEEQAGHSDGKNRGWVGRRARRTWGIFPLLLGGALGMILLSMICTSLIQSLRTV